MGLYQFDWRCLVDACIHKHMRLYPTGPQLHGGHNLQILFMLMESDSCIED